MSGDDYYMRRALALAAKGQGRVEPNPMVGALVVRDGIVVGQGHHQQFGGPHAEVHALEMAGSEAQGATLYVTLEPCCHHGKTPPCVEAILRAGIRKVVAAMVDPYPSVYGAGLKQLEQAGVEVVIGVEEKAAARLNKPFIKLVTTGTPYVIAKWAMTLDGKIATRTGDSKWISSVASRALVHQLRGRVDAVVTGLGTVITDNPLLTARPAGPRTPTRVVLDRQLRIPLHSQLVQTAFDFPLLVVHQSSNSEKMEKLTQLGAELLYLPAVSPGDMVKYFLVEAGKRRWTNVLLECGSQLAASFFEMEAIDETWVFVAGKVNGGSEARAPVAGRGVDTVVEAQPFLLEEVITQGGDVLLRSVRSRSTN